VTTLVPRISTRTPETDAAPWALADLPPFPAVALRLLELLSQEDVDVEEVARLIAAEPVFAADVLRVANSALYGRRAQVRSISQAVIVLGLERVRGISLTRAFGIYVLPAMGAEGLRRCWQHSLAGAILADRIAHASGFSRDVAYTAALLRDLGRLALLVKYPGPYSNLLAVLEQEDMDLLSTERALFDIDHCQAGEWLLRSMSLPGEFREVVTGHHHKIPGRHFGLVDVVRVADRLSEALGFGPLDQDGEEEDLDPLARELPESARSILRQDRDEMRFDVQVQIQFFTA